MTNEEVITRLKEEVEKVQSQANNVPLYNDTPPLLKYYFDGTIHGMKYALALLENEHYIKIKSDVTVSSFLHCVHIYGTLGDEND